ncbi:MAG: Asp-tRNA(Asn)/Glu-tRNA(Gln) amidotransferase subunit GatC [Syntrophomonadaceae bacterium]|jgi:aspartyl-tRNA(Asn)/glutamyl-tRNA(Gln) amidotransferase subunit C|nr:Asp-tRNA(Asn)/Glu-tRNA(Gln) amidotransferase subunit GatC [Syntrophomonadaceae bacterium]
MALTIAEVEHVALLARLSLSQEEKEQMAEQLGAILEYADRLKMVNTEDIEPLDNILPISNVFREDVVENSPERDEMLANAPMAEDGQYKVPKIL